MTRTFAILLLLTCAGFAPDAIARTTEEKDRSVDAAALAAQTRAIAKLESLLGRARDTREEALFLQRLSSLYYESSTLLFRLSHGHGGAYKAKHRQSLLKTVASVDRLLQRFPNLPYAHTPLSLRARAFDDLSLREKAKADYLTLVDRFPEAPKAVRPAWHCRIRRRCRRPRRRRPTSSHRRSPSLDPHFPFCTLPFGLGAIQSVQRRRASPTRRHADFTPIARKRFQPVAISTAGLAYLESSVAITHSLSRRL